MYPVAADLADDPGAHAVGALLDVAHDQVGDRVGGELVELGREVRAGGRSRAPHDVQAGAFGHRPQRRRGRRGQPAGGDVDQRAAAGVDVPPQLGLRESRVVEQAVAAVLPRQVEEDVLVRQGHAQVVGGHRAASRSSRVAGSRADHAATIRRVATTAARSGSRCPTAWSSRRPCTCRTPLSVRAAAVPAGGAALPQGRPDVVVRRVVRAAARRARVRRVPARPARHRVVGRRRARRVPARRAARPGRGDRLAGRAGLVRRAGRHVGHVVLRLQLAADGLRAAAGAEGDLRDLRHRRPVDRRRALARRRRCGWSTSSTTTTT